MYRMKAAGTADLLQCQRRIPHESACDLKSVLNERLHGRTAHKCVKAAPRFAAADIGGSCYLVEHNIFCIMFPDKREHFLDAYLRLKLDARILRPGQIIEIQKYKFENSAQIALNSHLVTRSPLTHETINILYQPVHLAQTAVFLTKKNKRQRLTSGDRLNVFPVDLVALRCDHFSRKDNIRHRIGELAG